jgi:hypothetical protein
MLVLFDQGTPVPIRPFLIGHTVKTAAEQGWNTLSNGNLLNAAEAAGFEILVTTDKNFTHQQNLQGARSLLWYLATSSGQCCAFMFERS